MAPIDTKDDEPGGMDPLMSWRFSGTKALVPAETWWSAEIELLDTSIEFFLVELNKEERLAENFHLPDLYRTLSRQRRDRQIVTVFARKLFFDLVFEGDKRSKLRIGRILLGRRAPNDLRNFEAAFRDLESGVARAEGTVIVAVIDDGIAFGHEQFRIGNDGSRVEFAWLMDGTPANMPKGRELTRGEIEALLVNHTHGGFLDEAAFYRDAGLLDFSNDLHKTAAFRRSHGTHVAALVAGQAPATADERRPLILVQLPAEDVEDTSGGEIRPELGLALVYILLRAEAVDPGGEIPLVINFSYGNFAASHDGTDSITRLLEFISSFPDREVRVVLPAGNGNLARCHAELEFTQSEPLKELHWRVLPDDRTDSYVEIWLPHRGPNPPDLVNVELVGPGTTGAAAVDAVPGAIATIPSNGPAVAQIHYDFFASPTERGRIMIAIAPTMSHEMTQPVAPSGIWRIRVTDKALAPEETVQVRIQRDDSLPGYPLRGRQSFFDEDCYLRFDGKGAPLDSDPAGSTCEVRRLGTLNAFATGITPIVIGGYVRSDGRPAVYSAHGPVTPMRDSATTHREGTDAMAVSDDSRVLDGVLSAGSGSGSYVAMNGTSVAAPQVARWIADELAVGNSGDRTATRDRAQSDEINSPLPTPRPIEERGGEGRLVLSHRFGPPRRESA